MNDKFKELIGRAVDLGGTGVPQGDERFASLISETKKCNDSSFTQLVNLVYQKVYQRKNSHDLVTKPKPTKKKKVNTPYIKALFSEIKRKYLWVNSRADISKITNNARKIAELDAEKGEEAYALIARGKIIGPILEKVKCNSDINKLIDEAKKAGANNYEVDEIIKKHKKAKEKVKSFEWQKISIPEPYYNISDENPYFIGNLKPAKKWTILIDETGTVFDERYFDNPADKENGKLTAILLPKGHKLEPKGSSHATDNDTASVVNLLSDFINKECGCGILGVNLDGMARVDVDYWYTGIERLVEFILRLLPLDESAEKIELEFLIEERGEVKSEAMQRICDSVLYQFAKADNHRANRFTINADVHDKNKTTTEIFKQYNCYVDALCCAWCGKRKEWKKMLKQYAIIDHCLLSGSVLEIIDVMDIIAKDKFVPIHLLNPFLIAQDFDNKDSLAVSLLRELGIQMSENAELWEYYANEVIGHLNSKQIDIRVLAAQVKWLGSYLPNNSEFPKKLELIWHTIDLAEDNHQGVAEFNASPAYLMKLIGDLFIEDAPLCCWAILHIAVQYTNEFRFGEAYNLIQNFIKQRGFTMQEAIYSDIFQSTIGLRYWGQLLSSCGQHLAFDGNNTQAIRAFEEAIKTFGKLSYDSERDIDQTTAYLATVTMDAKASNTQEVMEQYLGQELEGAIKSLAVNDSNRDKFHHYILLRYLNSQLAPEEFKSSYLDEKRSWHRAAIDAGHPWELIEFYRGNLLSDKNNKLKYFMRAYNIAKSGGATLKLIALAILGGIYYLNSSVKDEFIALQEEVYQELPNLSDTVKGIIAEQIDNPKKPLEFINQVLPFNFR